MGMTFTWDEFWSTRQVHFPDEDLVRFLAALPRPMHFLDLGCGPGRNGQAFTTFGHHVTGVDSSEFALKVVQKNKHYRKVFRARLDDLPVQDASYDGVVDLCTLQHCGNVQAAILEICRVLRPEGVLFSKYLSRKTTDSYYEGIPTQPASGKELSDWFSPLVLEHAERHIILYDAEPEPDGKRREHWVTVWRKHPGPSVREVPG